MENYAAFFDYDSAEFDSVSDSSMNEGELSDSLNSTSSDNITVEGSSNGEESLNASRSQRAQRVKLRGIRSARIRAKVLEEQDRKLKERSEREKRREERRMLRAGRKKKKQLSKKKRTNRRSTSKRMNERRKSVRTEFEQAFDRNWLQSVEPHLSGLSYLPQIGDMVVYCVQGHQEYLKYFPISEAPPWRSDKVHWRIPDWPYVLCRVDELEYKFPNLSTSSIADEYGESVKIPIVMEVTLSMLSVPLKNASSRRLWYDLPGRTNPFQFHVALQPHDLPEFLILQQRFEAGVKTSWSVGDTVRAAFTGDSGDIQFYIGVIKSKSDRDPSAWPSSPWGSLEVEYEVGGTDNFSPWEIQKRPANSTDWVEPFYLLEHVSCTPRFCDSLIAEFNLILDENELQVEPFLEPVPLDVVEGYADIVPLPMDIGTILDRLKNRFYRTKEAIIFDVSLIERNCHIFNSEESQISRDASSIVEQLIGAIEDVSDAKKSGKRDSRKRKIENQSVGASDSGTAEMPRRSRRLG